MEATKEEAYKLFLDGVDVTNAENGRAITAELDDGRVVGSESEQSGSKTVVRFVYFDDYDAAWIWFCGEEEDIR